MSDVQSLQIIMVVIGAVITLFGIALVASNFWTAHNLGLVNKTLERHTVLFDRVWERFDDDHERYVKKDHFNDAVRQLEKNYGSGTPQ